MTNTKHTQGPWSTSYDEDDNGLYIRTDSDTAICKMVDETGEDWTADEIEANAAFIVRACNAHDDLLEALKLVCTMYERATGLPTPSQAQRAIKKAEGGV